VKRHLFTAIVCAACSSPAKVPDRPVEPPRRPTDIQPTEQSSPEVSPELTRISWMLGRWIGDDSIEHWVAAAGAIYGISLGKDDKSFEVMIVDDGEGPGKPDGKLRFLAMPGGSGSTQFDLQSVEGTSVTFANPAHDFPKTINYRIAGVGKLAAKVAGGDKSIDYVFRETSSSLALDLEAADVAFAGDTKKRGIEGWVAAFATDGGMLRKGKRIEGHAAIRELMGQVLGSGTLAWAPITSGQYRNVGFTVGKATFTGAKPEDSWKSSYVTIWKRQADGTWKVLFDTGRVVNE
jgi:ketosteroid isomerase-like protein